MKISIGNNPVVQSKIGQDTATESARRVNSENKKNPIAKTDSTDISTSRSASFEDSRVATAKSAILYDVTVKDSDRLSELKAAVQNGTYNVSTSDLVDAILK
ncbi:flagellar biosynthesis anti-sigma factor FlgM [Acetobacterium wieringae]|uniref:flagellar biosynthesis anti-sigma factor FlgM n=1 Tax=Acetobacterium wieringae TaxID=52694 RepID=UPI0026ED6266|nr:flagellar biosynthesis anti-sigma factor FlgM [Acetobacterium wieringae]